MRETSENINPTPTPAAVPPEKPVLAYRQSDQDKWKPSSHLIQEGGLILKSLGSQCIDTLSLGETHEIVAEIMQLTIDRLVTKLKPLVREEVRQELIEDLRSGK